MRVGRALLLLLAVLSGVRAETAYFPKEQIRPGLRGQVRTVLQGLEIVSLETEIYGLQKDGLGPGLDLIIGRLVDEKTKLTGAVHGMSGSPLYIDGKMAGALSRRVAFFEKDGICGFTPIADMLTVDRRVREDTRVAGKEFPWKNLLALRPGVLNGEARSESLALPLSVGGISPEHWRGLFRKLNLPGTFLDVPGASGRSTEKIKTESLQPGSPIGAVFMTGDLRIGATGTLTWREGDRVLAFGHPMMESGRTEVPFAAAEIITTIASYMTPYKMANLGPVVGVMTQDRSSAVGGWLGRQPVLADFSIQREHEGQKRQELKGQFSPWRPIMPSVVAVSLVAALGGGDDVSRTQTTRIEGELSFEGLPSLNLNGVYSGQDEELSIALFDILSSVQLLYSQPWRELKATGLKLRSQTSEKQSVWQIEQVRVNLPRVKPGQGVKAVVTLRERYGATKEVEFDLVLPESLKHGSALLRMSGGRELDGDLISSHLGSVQSPEEMIRLLNQRRHNDRVYAQVCSAGVSRRVAGRTQPSLPASVAGVMQGDTQTTTESTGNETVWSETNRDLPGMVLGAQIVEVEIE